MDTTPNWPDQIVYSLASQEMCNFQIKKILENWTKNIPLEG